MNVLACAMFSESQRQSTHRIEASVSFVQIANEYAVDLLASLSSSSSSSPPSASSAASLFSLPSASALTGATNASTNSQASNRLLLSDLDSSSDADADADADAEARKLAHDVTHVVVDSAQAAVDAWATGVAQRRALAMVAAVRILLGRAKRVD
jgi:hypothetical protein